MIRHAMKCALLRLRFPALSFTRTPAHSPGGAEDRLFDMLSARGRERARRARRAREP
jgi:hypothetical protein